MKYNLKKRPRLTEEDKLFNNKKAMSTEKWFVDFETEIKLDLEIARTNPHHYNGELVDKLREILGED